MGYFDHEENVREYMQITDGYDGEYLIQKLRCHLVENKTILELGMGPGKDLDLLNPYYNVTGSDNSEIFLDLYRKKHPDADLLNLDAVTLQTDRVFDCIYSNKVLHHLTRSEMQSSLFRQLKLLQDNGIALHSLWAGEGEETHHGLLFTYFTLQNIPDILPEQFRILEMSLYEEMEKNDSIVLILQKC